MEATRVMVVDAQNLFRAGIRCLIDSLAGTVAVAEAADMAQALALVAAHRPDVLLTDTDLGGDAPGTGGFELAAKVSRDHPETRVIFLSVHREEDFVRRAILSGAVGYLLKDSETEELGLALRAVARGETYLSPAATRHLVTEYRRQAVQNHGSGGMLTQRQQEVLRLIAEGHGTKAVARELGISVKTVETHRTQLMDRLDIHEVAGLVRYAIRIGLVDPDR